jgi:uncharacterized membrane protein
MAARTLGLVMKRSFTVINPKRSLRANIGSEGYQLIQQLRERNPARNPPKFSLKFGDRWADTVADTVGSWRFIIIQKTLLILWLFLNVTAYLQHGHVTSPRPEQNSSHS